MTNQNRSMWGLILISLLMLLLAATMLYAKEKEEPFQIVRDSELYKNPNVILPYGKVVEAFWRQIEHEPIYVVRPPNERECTLHLSVSVEYWPTYNSGKAQLIWWLDEGSNEGIAPSGFEAIRSSDRRKLYDFMLEKAPMQGRRARGQVMRLCSP